MKKLFLCAYLLILVTIPTTLAIYANSTTAFVSLISLALAFFIFNIDKLESLKLYGLEAKLRRTISEANATIDQLKELAVVLAEPTISMIATQGINAPMPITYRLSLIERINFILDSLNIAEDEVERMNQVSYYTLRIMHQNKILQGISNPPRNLIVDESGKFPTSQEFELFLKQNNQLTDERRELILDFDHFIKTSKLRRPETWK